MARARGGRVVFVRGAAPEEDLVAEVTRARGRHAEARVVRLLSPGPARVEPQCAHFGTCGGCVLQHVAPSAQTQSKGRLLSDTLTRLGGLHQSQTTLETPWAAEPYRYRTRARFAVAADGRLGYRAIKSRSVVAVDMCPILHPLLEAFRVALSEVIAAKPGVERAAGSEVMAVTNAREVAAKLPKPLSNLREQEVRLPVPLTFGAQGRLDADDGRGPLWLAPGVFAQANRDGNQSLVEAVGGEILRSGARRVLELYAGAGNLTRTFSKHAEVRAVEGDRAAAQLGQDALPEVLYEIGPVEEVAARLESEGVRFDAVVVNPPRTGLTPETVTAVAALAPRVLVYVSCNAATFARDASRLKERGYRLRRARMFDLYPQTAHLEVFGVFNRAFMPVITPRGVPAEEARRPPDP